MTRLALVTLALLACLAGCGDDGGPLPAAPAPLAWPMAAPLCKARQTEPVFITPCTHGKDEFNVRPAICRDAAGQLAYDDCLILLNQDDSTVSTFCVPACYGVLP